MDSFYPFPVSEVGNSFLLLGGFRHLTWLVPLWLDDGRWPSRCWGGHCHKSLFFHSILSLVIESNVGIGTDNMNRLPHFIQRKWLEKRPVTVIGFTATIQVRFYCYIYSKNESRDAQSLRWFKLVSFIHDIMRIHLWPSSDSESKTQRHRLGRHQHFCSARSHESGRIDQVNYVAWGDWGSGRNLVHVSI